MLSLECSFWDISYPLCTYTSIFIIFLLAWQIRRSCQRLSLEPKKSCYRHHRKVRQRARDAAARARRLSREEAEKPWELLSALKSQSWIPKEGSVRQLLCLDPGCQICEAATLEIRQLLQSEKNQLSPALLGLPQGSACLEMSPMSFQQNTEFHSRHQRRHLPLVPENQALTELTEHLTQLSNTVGVQEYWTDQLQLEQKLHLADMPMVSETMASSRFEEPMVLMIKEKIMQSKVKLDQESQDLHHVESSVSLLSLDPKITDLSHTVSLHMDSMLSSHMPILSPKVRGLLELHVKKWIHFQKWGLPRRVEESLRQLLPSLTLLCRSRENSSSYILSSLVTRDTVGIVSHKTNSLYLASQPTQNFWVSEWPVINLKQGRPWHQSHTCLPSHGAEHLNNFYPLPEAEANDSGDNEDDDLQSEYYSQLFCGLPSLHSESLDVTPLSPPGICKKKNMPKPLIDAQPSGVLPGLFLPKTPSKSALPSSLTSPNSKTPYEQEGAQITVPFLTLAECEALENHLLEKRLKLQWGLPAFFLQNQYTLTQRPCEGQGKDKTVKTFWARNPFSYSTRKILPEHTRRLLEFHLQKQLIHQRWGLPQRIQCSIHMLLSSPNQRSLSYTGSRLSDVSISQPEADGSGGMFSSTAGKGSIIMPHLFAEARATLKSHVDTKCEQVHKGKVPAQVCSSWERKIPGGLASTPPFPCIPQGQCRKLQAESKRNPDLHHIVVPWKSKILSKETQALSGTLFEHCKRPQALPEETIKKLETTLHHKYLAFLSGLPALYCVALSRPASPAVTSQPRPKEKMPRPVRSLSRAPTQITPLKPCAQDDGRVSADVVEEVQPGEQADGRTENVPPESQPPLGRPYSLNTHILAKLNFHLKKKVLAMQFGVSEKERREHKELETTGLESESIQEFLRSLHIPESTQLQEQAMASPSPPAPNAKRVQLRKPASPAVQALKQKQSTSRAAPCGSAQQGSKASQFRRDTRKTQVCLDMETGRKKPNLEKPKAVGDLGEGDAGLGLYLVSQKPHRDREQELEKKTLHRTPQESSQQGHNFHLEGACLHSSQEPPELEFPAPPPEIFMETDSEQDTEDSQSEDSIVLEAARIAEVPHSEVSQASQASQTFQSLPEQAFQSLPSPCSPIQRKPFQVQSCPGHFSPGHMMPASPNTRPSHLPEAGLKNKMKFFLHSINPKTKSRTYTEPPVAKTSKENVERGLLQTKSPIKKTRSEDSRVPKAQSSSSERSVIASLLTAPHILDSKLRPRSRQLGPVSVLGSSRYCPRHCPKLAYATQ